jgi:hypothetical protein
LRFPAKLSSLGKINAMKKLLILVTLFFGYTNLFGQIVKDAIIKADTAKQKDGTPQAALSQQGINLLIEKRVSSYLAGTSNLSLSKFYAIYSTDNDRLDLGINFPVYGNDRKLRLVINPIFQSDVKKNFAAFNKDGKEQTNMRAGIKLSFPIIPLSYVNFPKASSDRNPRLRLQVLRTDQYKKMLKEKEEAVKPDSITLISGTKPIKRPSTNLKEGEQRKKSIEDYNKLATAEVDLIEKGYYSSITTGWISIWGFLPISDHNYWITPDINTNFSEQSYRPWEFNLQGTYLKDFRVLGTFTVSFGYKSYGNNSASAGLMTTVDFLTYNNLPAVGSTQHAAVTKQRKGFIGQQDHFTTENLNMQLVWMSPLRTTWIRPGLSFYRESNRGRYSPLNYRFGLPISIQGKEKPINLELQYQRNDLHNFNNSTDPRPEKIWGISLSLPVMSLHK